jgi:hypothetical protein
MTSKLQHLIGNDIRRNGRSVLCIGAEDGSPAFAYTIGNAIEDLPELLMIGGVCDSCAVNALDDLSQTMIERGSAFADGELVSLGAKYPVKIIDADQRARDEYTIQAGQYHDTEDYRVQQVLIPDRNGRYPDDPECQRPYATVPVLGHRRH